MRSQVTCFTASCLWASQIKLQAGSSFLNIKERSIYRVLHSHSIIWIYLKALWLFAERVTELRLIAGTFSEISFTLEIK